MKIKVLMAAALTAACVAQPASAEEAKPFAGGHVDLEAGWGRVGGSRHAGDGFIYGGRAGYDIALSNIRVGPEVEITGSTQKDCRPVAVNGATVRSCQSSDRDLYAGGRIGYVVSPAVMLYAKAGYTNARFSTRDGTADSVARDRSGYRVGGGAEYAFSSRAYVSLEYRYSQYRSDTKQNQIMGAVGVRF